MSAAEMMLWSSAAGAVGMMTLVSFVDAALARRAAEWRALGYVAACSAAVILLGGLADALWPHAALPLHVTKVLIGPVCAAVGCYGVSRWLHADQRDRMMRIALVAMMISAIVGGPLCLLLEPQQRLMASGALAITSMAIALWLAVRAAQRGDAMAWMLATGCLLTLPAQFGLYQTALSVNARPSLALQALTIAASLLSMVITGLVVWRRNRQLRHLHQDKTSQRDPASGLFNSLTMLQKIIASQRNRHNTRGDGALMAVMLFEPDALLPQIGHSGLNELYSELALRMRRHTGIINPAGRYYDSCFLVLFESMHSPRLLRTLSLRVAASLRFPVELTSLSGERLLVSADVGVGIIHISNASRNVDDLVHDAQELAKAARYMPSRAALFDPVSRLPVPVESAELGLRWKPLRAGGKNGPKTRPPRKSHPGRTRPV